MGRLLMNKYERGSVSIFLLISALIIAFTAQLALLWGKQELQASEQRLISQRLRLLTHSFLQNLQARELAVGQYTCFTGSFKPGDEPVEVVAKSEASSYGLIKFLEVKGTAANHAGAVQRLCQITLSFAEPLKSWAGQYALASRTAEGMAYLEQEELYIQASKEEVTLPEVRFLYGRATSNMSATEAANEGLTKHFTYLDSDSTFSFTRGSTLLGDSVFVNKGSIVVNANCVFPNRLALYSQKGSITIGDNVRMDKAIVHAYSTVTIGSGSKINGLIIANKIILKGASSFSADADVVAQFASCVFTD